jgi:plasmid stabilization system protein ParE
VSWDPSQTETVKDGWSTKAASLASTAAFARFAIKQAQDQVAQDRQAVDSLRHILDQLGWLVRLGTENVDGLRKRLLVPGRKYAESSLIADAWAGQAVPGDANNAAAGPQSACLVETLEPLLTAVTVSEEGQAKIVSEPDADKLREYLKDLSQFLAEQVTDPRFDQPVQTVGV